jgi:hypothetical protein
MRPTFLGELGSARCLRNGRSPRHYSVHQPDKEQLVDDNAILTEINRLVAEERRLEEEAIGRGPENPEHDQLKSIKTTLDQCWDLLRQRRARREFGEDPDQAEVRDASIVERYLQ